MFIPEFNLTMLTPDFERGNFRGHRYYYFFFLYNGKAIIRENIFIWNRVVESNPT